MVEKGAGLLTGADGHLGAASRGKVLQDHRQLAATRELQGENTKRSTQWVTVAKSNIIGIKNRYWKTICTGKKSAKNRTKKQYFTCLYYP